MFNKDLLQKAKSFTNKEDFFKFAKEEGFTLSDEELDKYFNALNQANELSDEELENVAGGGCQTYSDVTYKSLDIFPYTEGGQGFYNHPLITTAINSCSLLANGSVCGTCYFSEYKAPTLYCRARSKELDTAK